MFPWNYGFEWNASHVIFLGAFYTVLAIVAATVVSALVRAQRDLRARRAEDIRWHSEFEDLPARDQVCRHVLTGEFSRRECPNAFDCRKCETHGRLIANRPVAAAEGDDEILGMAFPLDRFYHRGHTWARPETDGTVTIGLDEMASRLAGKPDTIELPAVGTQVRVNGQALRIRKRNADVRVLSPVDGEVIETGGPEKDWLLRVNPSADGERAFRHLLRGAEIRPWLLREMERLQLALTMEGAAPALADGGVPVRDMAEACPGADWDAVCGEMFLMG
jgi:glycine cleavage system H lipoate-binding protein